jgi:hypothetical protein
MESSTGMLAQVCDRNIVGVDELSGETGSGWQVQALTSPLTIQANTTYVVSVNANQYYVATNSGLASRVINGDLSSVADGANGVYGSPPMFPTSSYENTNYFRDISFAPQ